MRTRDGEFSAPGTPPGIPAPAAGAPRCGLAWARHELRLRLPVREYDGFDEAGEPIDYDGAVIAPPPAEATDALWIEWWHAVATLQWRRARGCGYRGCRRRRLCQFPFGTRCPRHDEILLDPFPLGRRRRAAAPPAPPPSTPPE